MRKNQALSIALILFVIIACVLGGTTYYFKKNADELLIAKEQAVKVLPGKDAKIEELSNEIQVLKSYSHSDWREMVPHSGFDLHFSDKE